MPSREIHFEAKDEALRDDVRVLGALVGEVIREQGGDQLFERVEKARRAAIRRRRDEGTGSDAESELGAILSGLGATEAELLTRAFSAYFQVVNLAEQVHRIRRRRDYLRERPAGGPPQPGSLEGSLRRLREAGIGPGEVRDLLAGIRIEPVFTAHPTEATRQTILKKHLRIARRLVERMDPSRTPLEERAALARIRGEITSSWQTEEHPAERPTVADEREHVLFHVLEILYRVIPSLYEELEEALEKVYGAESQGTFSDLLFDSPLVRFASWVGGDMDGNPNVSARTLEESLRRQRRLLLERYRREIRGLYDHLSQTVPVAAVDRAVYERIGDYSKRFPEALETVPSRHRDMPYRVLLTLVDARLAATLEDSERAYGAPEGLSADLELLAASLEHHRGTHGGLFPARRALRRVATFGFHLATLDARQDALVHRRVVGRLLGEITDGEESWLEASSAERTGRLQKALGDREAPGAERSEEDRETLEVFAALARCRERFGRRSIGPFIISMSQGADDVLSVLLLARWGGLADAEGRVPLDVAPLFETVPDLQAAPGILLELLADDAYRPHLERRGDHQVIMIGYSDSNKDGGLAAARWALQRGQAALVETLVPRGIDPVFFHGRGGSISRGGGKTHRAVMAAPRGSVRGRLRVTEQGEVINNKFGLRGIALRNLERTLGAVALATAAPPPPDPREPQWEQVMQEIAGDSRRSYRALVYDEPAFVDYFRTATPVDVIEKMRIGSRPASRRSKTGIENLRAIPWVFSWTQSRHLLPGWYGLGTALEAAVAAHGIETLAGMVREWPFLRTLIDDAEMVLAKADLGIAERYAALAGDVGEKFFPRIREEFDRTVAAILELKEADELLDDDPTLKRSIRLRNPYVDPMSLLQVDLLRRWRAAGSPTDPGLGDGELFSALLATVNGIARGLRNTG